jgi:hypothetical protein
LSGWLWHCSPRCRRSRWKSESWRGQFRFFFVRLGWSWSRLSWRGMEQRSLGEGRRSGGELVPEILACFCCCWCCGGAAAARAAQQETTASRSAAADGLLPAPIGLTDAVLSSLLRLADRRSPLRRKLRPPGRRRRSCSCSSSANWGASSSRCCLSWFSPLWVPVGVSALARPSRERGRKALLTDGGEERSGALPWWNSEDGRSRWRASWKYTTRWSAACSDDDLSSAHSTRLW